MLRAENYRRRSSRRNGIEIRGIATKIVSTKHMPFDPETERVDCVHCGDIHAGQIVHLWRGQAHWRATKSDALRAQTNSDVIGELQEGLCRLCRPGGDLLSHALRRSTISAGEFNDRVRNGIGWRLPAKTTRPAKTTYCESLPSDARIGHRAEFMSNACGNKSLNGPFAAHEPLHASFRRSWHEDDQTNRAISTG